MKDNKIYLDEAGYQSFLKSIDELREKLKKNSKAKSDSYSIAVGDGWHDNFDFEEAKRQELMIMRQIQEKYEQLNNIEIIKDKKSEDTASVNLNDVVRLSFRYPNGEVEEEVVKLIAASQVSDHDNFTEISVNSPLGEAIYKNKVGDVVEYVAGESRIQVEIKEKLVELNDENQKGNIKK